MPARGPYAKGRAKRAEILDVALAVIERDGYSAATVKQLADAVGLSQNGLLHYFGSKDALYLEIMRHRDVRLHERFDPAANDLAHELGRRILDAMTDAAATPGMIQLTARLAAEAADPAHPGHAFFRERLEQTRRVTHDAVARLQDEGVLPASVDPESAAALITASMDGLHAHGLYDATIDTRRHMAYLLRALGFEADGAPAS